MRVKIQSRSFSLSRTLNEYTNSKIRLTLGLYIDKIQQVDVLLSNVNGSKGDEGILCKIKIKADGYPSIITQEIAGGSLSWNLIKL
jgi:putative sigma-54 modulation protein